MALFDFIKGMGNKVKNTGSNLFDMLRREEPQEIEFAPLPKVEGANSAGLMPDGSFAQRQPLQLEYIQVDENGQQIPNAQFHPMNTNKPNANNPVKNNLFSKIANKTVDAVFGKQAPATDNINANTMEVTVSDNPRVGGLINDITGGYRENRDNAFNLENWGNNDLGNDREKGLAYRFGEGLGTTARGLKRVGGALGRFADTPLGRAAIMAGVVGATGGSGLQALAYGGTAGLGNQVNRMNDKLYRQDLEAQGIDTSNIKGYITKDTYQNLINSRIAQENAAYRRMYYDNQNINQQELIEFRKREAERQARQDAFDNSIKQQQVAQGWAKIKADDEKKGTNNVANLQAVSQQLKRFEDSFKGMPNKLESNTLGRFRNFTGLQTETEANFNSQRQLLFNKIARDLGGEKGVLSDQDIKRIEGALPSYTDSYAQKQAKMQAIYDLLNDRLSVEGGSLGQTTQSGTTQVGKYKVRVK